MNRREAEAALQEGRARDVLVDRLCTDSEPHGLTALGLLYVGDELARLNGTIAAGARIVATATAAAGSVASAVVTRLGGLVDELAPPVRNGAGEVVGRSIEVSAALRSEGMGAVPAHFEDGGR